MRRSGGRHRQRVPDGARRARGRARDRRAGPVRARELHRRAGAAARARGRGRPARAAEAAGDGALGARLRRGPAAGRARLRADRPARAGPRRAGTCSRAAAPGSRASSSTPGRPSSATGRSWAASARARSTSRCTAPSRAARVDFCPRVLAAADGPTLMKCCLFERGIRREGASAGRAVGRGARGGPRGAAGAVRDDLRAPVGDGGDARAVRRRGAHADLALGLRRAGAEARASSG